MIEFGLGERALVGHDDPEGRIGEPDRPVGRDRDIVGRVDPLALVMRHDRLGLAVIIAAAADAAPAMLAMDERAVCLDGIAVHEPGAVDHDLDMAIGIPAEQPPVGYVRPDQPIMRGLPCGPLAVDRSLIELQQRRIGAQHLRQPIVVDLDTAKALHDLGWTGIAQQTPRKQVGG